MNKIKVSAVSYTNSKPFVYGLNHSQELEDMELSLDIPSVCANKLIDNQVDIGLVPVAALLHIPGYKIISPFCIGADGAVDSVFIFSNKPIEAIRTVQLDPQSRTSNNLAKVLLKNYWKVRPDFVETADADAFVLIGDRTFGKKETFPFVYDLAREWKNFTGLPFAFAVWASNKEIPEKFVRSFNKALAFGLQHKNEVIQNLPRFEGFDYEDYLLNKIDFDLDAKKLEAINKFHELIRKL